MNLESLRAYCLSFPDATEQVQWGADLVFKIGGKMFTVACLDPGETKVSFKCTPEEFAELVEHEDVKPADYVARYHWVTLLAWDALPDREVRRLVKDSYDMVRAKLPKKRAAAADKSRKSTKRTVPKATKSKTRTKARS
jgi:predicted DNA-binding protein (MmcQ/YjbR family)